MNYLIKKNVGIVLFSCSIANERRGNLMDKTILLNPTDYVGVTFWLISAAMVAATFFFWVERDRAEVSGKLHSL